MTMTLTEAVEIVVADFRQEDPDRADMTDAAIIAETVASLDRHDIETLRDGGDIDDQTATGYYAVLDNAADACRLVR